ncbi:MAG: amidohydrolase family protein [Clostridia bacterium]|nr:amidohydrolase family protein [Clostridia bacterium]
MNYAFIHGIILDGTENMEPVKGKVVLVRDDIIYDIVDHNGVDLKDYEIIDLEGKYLMPGLINLHVHLPGSGKPSKKGSDTAKLVKLLTSNALLRKVVYMVTASAAKTELMSGVTTLRSVGGVMSYDSMVRDDILKGKIAGPRILAGNMGISVPGGHMAGSLAYECTSPEQAKELVEIIAKDKPDLLKLMVTGGVLDAKVKGEPGELKMSPEIIKAACEKAHEKGMMVAAHVESPEGVKEALKNGVDTIEHGAKPDAEMMELFRSTGAKLVATVSPAIPFALFPRDITGVTEVAQYNGDIVFQGIIENAKACLNEGIMVGLGTDTGCPYITHYDTWREVYNFAKYVGVDNRKALYTATLGNARIVGIDSITGSIEKGKSADLIAVKENPLDRIEALRNVSMVVARGNLVMNPAVKKMKQVEDILDRYM